MTQQIVALYDGKEFTDAKRAIWALYRALDEGHRLRLPRIVRGALERYLKKVATVVATRNTRTWPGNISPGPRDRLNRRSGTANESIHNSVRIAGGREQLYTLQGYIGGIYYLRTHEFGAVIRARGDGWLTIPLPAALDSRGVPLRRSARDWNNTFIQRSRNGNLLIFQNRAEGIVPLYVLKKEVRIPPRLGMSLTLDQLAFSFLEDVLRETRREFFA